MVYWPHRQLVVEIFIKRSHDVCATNHPKPTSGQFAVFLCEVSRGLGQRKGDNGRGFRVGAAPPGAAQGVHAVWAPGAARPVGVALPSAAQPAPAGAPVRAGGPGDAVGRPSGRHPGPRSRPGLHQSRRAVQLRPHAGTGAALPAPAGHLPAVLRPPGRRPNQALSAAGGLFAGAVSLPLIQCAVAFKCLNVD
ncbi:hypothetical protein D910_07196 [Dendroctonus ponderosae]|uniref:Uncharacterized protein n=1 Tax=Dendroctonus ponderosae TaxID=77166 RepID=U4UGY8_DENPD|nr:hypothetical protein D910_07196 [Dendroctonus ponderosae]